MKKISTLMTVFFLAAVICLAVAPRFVAAAPVSKSVKIAEETTTTDENQDVQEVAGEEDAAATDDTITDTETDNIEDVVVADDSATTGPNWLYAGIAVGVIFLIGLGAFFFVKRKK
jgi:LPXTG-motif cell wall-anchored protein